LQRDNNLAGKIQREWTLYMLTSAPFRLVADDRPTFSPSQNLRTTDGPARAWIRDRNTKTKKWKKRICIETLKKTNLLLMTVSVQKYTK
jgi:hypothetical protein